MKINVQNPGSYYGITSFSSLQGNKAKEDKYAAMYSAGSEKSQMSALSSAINTLKTNAVNAGSQKEKDALNAQVSKITSAMQNSFSLTQSMDDFSKPDKRSLHEIASAQADEMLDAIKSGKSINKLV